LDPGSIAAGAREIETVAIPGVVVGDCVVICPRATMALVIGYARVSAANAVEFSLENNTVGAVDLASGTFDYQVLRGSTMAIGRG
jgi:hypothetical protein